MLIRIKPKTVLSFFREQSTDIPFIMSPVLWRDKPGEFLLERVKSTSVLNPTQRKAAEAFFCPVGGGTGSDTIRSGFEQPSSASSRKRFRSFTTEAIA